MPDYKENPITGKQWTRCNAVYIRNPYGGTPSIDLQEEVVAQAGDKTWATTEGVIAFPFDPAMEIELRNPETGELLGATMTGMDVYVALYSLYIQRATERDEASNGN